MPKTTNYRKYDFYKNDLYELCRHIYFSRREDETYDEGHKKVQKWTRIMEYFFQNPDAFGAPFLIENMLNCVESTAILDYDGMGELINFDTFEKIEISSIENTESYANLNDDYFILWYNK